MKRSENRILTTHVGSLISFEGGAGGLEEAQRRATRA